MKAIHTFEVEFKVDLSPKERDEARVELNLHFFNDTVCNHIVDGIMVAKYPEIEAANPNINEAYYNVVRGKWVTVYMDLMEDGTLKQQ